MGLYDRPERDAGRLRRVLHGWTVTDVRPCKKPESCFTLVLAKDGFVRRVDVYATDLGWWFEKQKPKPELKKVPVPVKPLEKGVVFNPGRDEIVLSYYVNLSPSGAVLGGPFDKIPTPRVVAVPPGTGIHEGDALVLRPDGAFAPVLPEP